MPLLTSRSAQLVLKRAPGDPKQASGFPGSPPTTRKPGIPPLPLDVLREGVGPSALHPIPSRRKHTHPGLSHGPDSQTLQPKFNFQLLLTLDRERSKLERVKGGGAEGREGGSYGGGEQIPTQMPAGAGTCGGQRLSITRLLRPPSLQRPKKAALRLGVKKEGWGWDCFSGGCSYCGRGPQVPDTLPSISPPLPGHSLA